MAFGIFLIGLCFGLVIGLALGVRKRTVIVRAVSAALAPVDAAANSRPCAVCGQPANPVRFHDGRYLCSGHKG